jgi:hypothetical protein
VIALVLSSAWPRYYASSPFRNLLNSSHPDFVVLGRRAEETLTEEFRATVNACEALVVDDVLAPFMGFYTAGPKLMVGGDPHAHRPDQVERLEREYASVDWVLTGAVYSKKLPQYLYPREETRAKHVYFPHSVPNEKPEAPKWRDRIPSVLLSGSMSKDVYPFRWQCNQLMDCVLLHGNEFQHEAYFEKLGQYQAAVTCNSVLEYTVAKYFEIPWMGCVLMAPPPSAEECELLGLNARTFQALKDPSEIGTHVVCMRDEQFGEGYANMAEAGKQIMERYHTVNKRLDYVKDLVKYMKGTGFKPEDAKGIFFDHRMRGPHEV